MTNQDKKIIELRNENNDNLPSFPSSVFTMVNLGTDIPLYPELPENLTIIISEKSKKPGKDFIINGSKIKFNEDIYAQPEVIILRQEMKEEESFELGPDPSCFTESIRDIGYTLETAIADIIDNSISALAKNIYINIDSNNKTNGLILEIIDDGIGMNKNELIIAMRLGSKNPTFLRDKNDLGRFGLGLKMASFSQCRKLTVESCAKENDEKNSFTWDLDEISKTRKWLLKKNKSPEIEIGTKVIWEKLDRFEIDLSDDQKKIQQIQLKIGETTARIEKHISRVFHRFIDNKNIEKDVRRIKIFLNDKEIKPNNPFNEYNNATFISPLTKVPNSSMKINYFILPHKDKCKEREYEEYAGEEGYLENQGFYVYRNYRLIIWGTWFRIMEKVNALKLCRVKIDIGNDEDSKWKIDVKKSNATPPKIIRDFLDEYLRNVEIKGRRVIDGKIAKFSIDDKLKIWVPEKIKRTKTTIFKINKKNPLIKKIIKNMDYGLEIIKEIEDSVPYDLINLHINDTKQKFKSAFNPNKQEVLDRCKLRVSMGREDNIDDDRIKKSIILFAEEKNVELSTEDFEFIFQ